MLIITLFESVQLIAFQMHSRNYWYEETDELIGFRMDALFDYPYSPPVVYMTLELVNACEFVFYSIIVGFPKLFFC